MLNHHGLVITLKCYLCTFPNINNYFLSSHQLPNGLNKPSITGMKHLTCAKLILHQPYSLTSVEDWLSVMGDQHPNSPCTT